MRNTRLPRVSGNDSKQLHTTESELDGTIWPVTESGWVRVTPSSCYTDPTCIFFPEGVEALRSRGESCFEGVASFLRGKGSKTAICPSRSISEVPFLLRLQGGAGVGMGSGLKAALSSAKLWCSSLLADLLLCAGLHASQPPSVTLNSLSRNRLFSPPGYCR